MGAGRWPERRQTPASLSVLGVVHDDLRTFLDTNLPKEKKRAKMILGVADSRIASTVNELFSITCQHTGVVPELLRGQLKTGRVLL